MKQYLDALADITANGTDRSDRTGVGTRSIFGYQMRFDLNEGFPAVTTKKLAWRAVVGELLWFLEGSTDERRLAEITHGDLRGNLSDRSTIWTANADNQGVALGYPNSTNYKELGPVYGKQWRDFNGFDQIGDVLNKIIEDPDSRRIIMSSWNAGQVSQMSLPPCHVLAQFYVSEGKLSCLMYQRSADMFLGVPFNIASYALLTHMLADRANLKVGEFVHSIGDAHIYHTHKDAVAEQLNRKPAELPTLKMPKIHTLNSNRICEYSVSDFELLDYKSQSSLKAPMAV